MDEFIKNVGFCFLVGLVLGAVILVGRIVYDRLSKHRAKEQKASEEPVMLIFGDLRGGEEGWVACTCGWKYGPEKSPRVLGREAGIHRAETGHRMRGL